MQHLPERWGEFDQATADDPYPLYAELRRDTPVRRVILADGRPAWLVTRYSDAREALTSAAIIKSSERAGVPDPGTVSGRLPPRIFGYNMLNADPPDHTRLRGLVSGVFTPAHAEALRPRVQQIADGLLDAMAGRDRVDLVAEFAFPLPITVISELLGVPVADRRRIRSGFDRLFSCPVPGEGLESAEAARELIGYFSALIEAKRAEPGDDLLSRLCAAADHELSSDELLSTAFLLVLAGHETTMNLIAGGTAALLCHPEQLAALRADPTLIPAAVEEFLRYDGPLQHATPRFTVSPVEIGGVTIPAHQQVLVLLAGANRDTERFADADLLDVGREENRHLAFGHGIHFCLGAALARIEGQIAFTSLLRRFPGLRLAVAEDELHWRYGIVLRSMLALPVMLRQVPQNVR